MISAPKVPRLRIRNFIPRGGWYHVARHVHQGTHSSGPHSHDFPEVFWVERGTVLHTVNGERQDLRAGEVTLVRPPDTHGFRTPADGYTLVNVAFHTAHWEDFRARYFGGRGKPWPWSGGRLPARFQVQAEDLPRLAWLADELARGPQSRLRLEAFLSGLLLCLGRDAGVSAHERLPDWLRAALVEFARPQHLPGGVPALARLAGRTQEHINRVMRKHLGQTTTDILNTLRLDYAARELGMSGRPILEIALDAGFENLSYFYRLFAKRFGATPRRYRLQKQMLLK